MEEFADQRDRRKIDGHHASGRKCVSQAALEDDVHVHQAIADDGVTKAQRNQCERVGGRLHPRRRHPTENVRDDVEQHEGQSSRESAAGDPFQLLAENTAGRAPVTQQKNSRRYQEIDSQSCQLHFVEPVACADSGQKIQRPTGHEGMQRQQSHGHGVGGNELGPQPAAALRENQREVDEQGRLQQQRDHVGPVDGLIEDVQLAGVMEAVQHKGHQAENIEMDGARRIPPAHENEKADEEIQQRGNAQVVFNRRGIFLRRRDQRCFKLLSAAAHRVADFRPWSHVEQHAGNIRGSMNREAADRLHDIALLDPRLSRR